MCNHVENVSALLLGALDEHERSWMKAHLEECHNCQTERDSLQPALSHMLRVPPSGQPRKRVRRSLYRWACAEQLMLRRRESSKWMPRPQVIVVASLFAVFVGLMTNSAGALLYSPPSLNDGVTFGKSTASASGVQAALISGKSDARLNVAPIPPAALGHQYAVWERPSGEKAQIRATRIQPDAQGRIAVRLGDTPQPGSTILLTDQVDETHLGTALIIIHIPNE